MAVIANFNIEEVITECSYTDDTVCISEYIINKAIATSDNVDIGTKVDELKRITECDTQKCVIEYLHNEKIIDKHEYEQELLNIKPIGPANSREWINNTNIEDVFKRYHKRYPSFYYFSYQMVDFAKFNTKFYRADWPSLMKNYDTFAVVINTDSWQSHGPGRHWFTIFIDARTRPVTIEYFNSSGRKPYIEIIEWYAKVERELKGASIMSQFIPVAIEQLQFNNDACGVYSLFYVYYRLKNIPYSKFTSRNIYDSKMTKFRKFLFNES